MFKKATWTILAVAAINILMAAAPSLAKDEAGDKGCLDCHPDFYEQLKGAFDHQPFKEKRCEACHVFHEFSQKMELAGEVFDLCTNCHESFYLTAEEDLHYAVVEDESCMSCHLPHSADKEKLLRGTDSGICLDCHDDEPGVGDAVHPPFADQECSGCHDPHGTEFTANLLLPTFFVCIDCHGDMLQDIDPGAMHGGDDVRSCENCHEGHFGPNAHLLKDTVPGLCFGCHENQAAALEAEYAHAVLEDCLDCHTPHRHRADLTDKALCAECHDFEDADFLIEHEVEDIESCLDCHDPHGSAEEFMLE